MGVVVVLIALSFYSSDRRKYSAVHNSGVYFSNIHLLLRGCVPHLCIIMCTHEQFLTMIALAVFSCTACVKNIFVLVTFSFLCTAVGWVGWYSKCSVCVSVELCSCSFVTLFVTLLCSLHCDYVYENVSHRNMSASACVIHWLCSICEQLFVMK